MRFTLLSCALMVVVLGMAIANPPAAIAPQLLGHYFTIQKVLAADSLTGVAGAASELSKLSRKAATTQSAGKAELLALSESAEKFGAADLKTARASFGDLSDKMIAFVKASNSPRNPPYQYYCSMVKKNWLQPDKGTRNPYYGSSMLTCGELVP
jgi:hypothetical protein